MIAYKILDHQVSLFLSSKKPKLQTMNLKIMKCSLKLILISRNSWNKDKFNEKISKLVAQWPNNDSSHQSERHRNKETSK